MYYSEILIRFLNEHEREMIGIKRQCDNHSGQKVVIKYLNVTMTRLNVVDKWLLVTDSKKGKLMVEFFASKALSKAYRKSTDRQKDRGPRG